MPSPALIDINAFLEPISEESAVGEDIRGDLSPTSLYSTIKDARNAARSAERNSMFDGTSTEAIENWNKILDLAPQILTSTAKDLEIACWYTEALVRKCGFQGLRDGFTLIKRLIEQYWDDDLYPVPDEDGLETRVAPITGLNGEGADGVLLTPIRSTHITDDIPPGPFSLWQYKQAVDINRISDEDNRTEQISKVGFSMEDIESAVEQSSPAFFVDLRDDIKDCLTEFKDISDLLTQYCGNHDAPPTSKIIGLLEETLSAVNHIAKHKFPIDAMNDDLNVSEGAGSDLSGNSSMPTGSVSNRDEAFRQLQVIADFFRRTEPHSPISYVLSKAIKWGDMPLEQLMDELIPDSSSRYTYSTLTGVRTNDE